MLSIFIFLLKHFIAFMNTLFFIIILRVKFCLFVRIIKVPITFTANVTMQSIITNFLIISIMKRSKPLMLNTNLIYLQKF